MLAYVLVLQFIAFMCAASLGLTSDLLPSPFVDSAWMNTVLALNAIAVLLRVVQRVYFVTRLYGWEQGIVSIPRMVVANFINFLAVSRAWRLFASHLVTGKRLAWDKTMHDFPSAAGLSEKRRQRLGELLVSWQAINEDQLKTAMEDELASEAPLGRVLIARGWLDEETLAEALSFQSELQRAALDPALLDEGQVHVPLEHAIRYRVLPQGTDHAGRRIVLAASPLEDDALKEIERVAGTPVTQRIVRESEIATGFRFLRGADNALEPNETNVPLLGDLLIQMGYITRESFNEALKVYRPERDGRIGEFMVAYGAISARALSDAVQTQIRTREAGQHT
jgi:bacteriophage N4 adsorption protein B